MLENESFRLLLDDLKATYKKDFSPKNKLDLIYTMSRMRLKDQELLEMYASDLRMGKFKDPSKVTNLLYVMAKMRFTSHEDTNKEWVSKAMDVIL